MWSFDKEFERQYEFAKEIGNYYACANRLRTLTEKFTSRLLNARGIRDTDHMSLSDRIEYLKKQNIFDNKSIEYLKFIKEIGNEGSHGAEIYKADIDIAAQAFERLLEKEDYYLNILHDKYILAKESYQKEIEERARLAELRAQNPNYNRSPVSYKKTIRISSIVGWILGIAILILVIAFFIHIFRNVFKSTKIDMDKEISEYYEDSWNHITLSIGNTHKPQAAIWLNGGGGNTASSNTSVVTVSSKGIVKAVGRGTAYVVIMSSTGMSETYKYTVK